MDPLSLDRLLSDPQEFAHLTGRHFRGLTISENGTGYNVVVRAFDGEGNALYAMNQHTDPYTGLKELLAALSTTKGSVLWRRDKYYGNYG